MKKFMAMSLVLAVVTVAGAVQFQPLSVPEAAWLGATHKAIITEADLTTATTNTAQALTNAIPAGTAVECVGMRLVTAFDTANTNYTGSLALIVGDGSDTDLFLASTELASDGTEVFVKYAPPHSATVSYTSAILTNVLYNGATGNVTVVTGVTGAATVGELGRKLYASAGSLVFTFTPNTEEAVSANTKGEVEVYFRLIQK